MNSLYEHFINVPGIIVEFGVRWGQTIAMLQSLRAIHEPYNHRRMILGFDTFEGFPSVNFKDGSSPSVVQGAYSVSDNYEKYLEDLLCHRERQSAMGHITKYSLIKGDVSDTLPTYLKRHPETLIAFAYFDLDLYEPTLNCLKAIKPHLTKGSVIGFDELVHAAFPGEAIAVQEALGFSSVRLQRNTWCSEESFLVVE